MRASRRRSRASADGRRETRAVDCPFLTPIELNRFRGKNESAAIVKWNPNDGGSVRESLLAVVPVQLTTGTSAAVSRVPVGSA